jgi:hypothetical protein
MSATKFPQQVTQAVEANIIFYTTSSQTALMLAYAPAALLPAEKDF